MRQDTGKLIVIYGINNLGKTTQAHLLVDQLKQAGSRAEYLKYPIYNIEPTGPQLNQILRSGRPQTISEIELQEIYAQNRRDFQPQLETKLKAGDIIVAEDYIGTGIAWGAAKGAPLGTLEKQNADLIPVGIAILLDGERFLEAKESNHLHESNDELMARCRQIHQQLAEKYDWQTINANQPPEKVAKDIWQRIESQIKN